jgi:hypothetical protein
LMMIKRENEEQEYNEAEKERVIIGITILKWIEKTWRKDEILEILILFLAFFFETPIFPGFSC